MGWEGRPTRPDWTEFLARKSPSPTRDYDNYESVGVRVSDSAAHAWKERKTGRDSAIQK